MECLALETECRVVGFLESVMSMAYFLSPVENGERVVLDKAVIFVGRHPDCDVVLKNSRKVSRRHCCIAQVDNRIVVRDLGSMNGVRVNGERIDIESPLGLGDEISFGDISYILQTPESLAEENQSAPQAVSPIIEVSPAAELPTIPDQNPEPKQEPGPRPKVPVNLSQNYPVPIDDNEGEEFVVEPSIITGPAVAPLIEEIPVIKLDKEDSDEEEDVDPWGLF